MHNVQTLQNQQNTIDLGGYLFSCRETIQRLIQEKLCETINTLAEHKLVTLNHLMLFGDIFNRPVAINRGNLYQSNYLDQHINELIKTNTDLVTKHSIINWITIIAHWIYYGYDASNRTYSRLSILNYRFLDTGTLADEMCKPLKIDLMKQFVQLVQNYVQTIPVIPAFPSSLGFNNQIVDLSNKIVIVCKSTLCLYHVTSVAESVGNHTCTSTETIHLKDYTDACLIFPANSNIGWQHRCENPRYTAYISSAHTYANFCLKYPFASCLIEHQKVSGLTDKINQYLNNNNSSCYIFIDESTLNDMLIIHNYNTGFKNNM